MSLVNRTLELQIKKILSKYPIIAVTGPRQSGKTTLLKKLLPGYKYISLENIDNRKAAEEDPISFFERYRSKVIFDEVQQVPHLFSYMQTIVDESGEMGQFILSGSQNFNLLEQITQSLAGRVALFKLLPFDFSELSNASLMVKDWKELLIKGCYPAIYDRDLDASIFYANYVETYINRDVKGILNLKDARQFNSFIRLCATRTGQLINMNNLANACGISQPTAKSWLSILESSYIVFLLPPYFQNFSKRVRKKPKLFFYDTGLASYLLGLRTVEDLYEQSLVGNLFENLIIAEMIKKNHHQNLLKEYWFWKDSNDYEIDLMTKKGNQFDIFEVKSTKTFLPKLAKNLHRFDEITNGAVKSKTVIYGGEENFNQNDVAIRRWQLTDVG